MCVFLKGKQESKGQREQPSQFERIMKMLSYISATVPAKESPEPGVLFTQDYCFGLKLEERKIVEICSTKKLVEDNSST
jgi:hypothetical protein